MCLGVGKAACQGWSGLVVPAGDIVAGCWMDRWARLEGYSIERRKGASMGNGEVLGIQMKRARAGFVESEVTLEGTTWSFSFFPSPTPPVQYGRASQTNCEIRNDSTPSRLATQLFAL